MRSLTPLKDADRFLLPSHFEEGKEKCPYDPARGYTGLIVGKQHFSQGWQGHAGCPHPGPIPSTPMGQSPTRWALCAGALASQDLVILLLCPSNGGAGGFWGCPAVPVPC